MFPHTSCRLCHAPRPPPFPSTSVSKAGSLAVGPMCKFVCFRVQVGGFPESAYLFPCKLVNFDRHGQGGEKSRHGKQIGGERGG